MQSVIKKEVCNQLVNTARRTRKLKFAKTHPAIQKAFEQKFRKIGVHNPLLYELEQNDVNLL